MTRKQEFLEWSRDTFWQQVDDSEKQQKSKGTPSLEAYAQIGAKIDDDDSRHHHHQQQQEHFITLCARLSSR